MTFHQSDISPSPAIVLKSFQDPDADNSMHQAGVKVVIQLFVAC